MSTTQKIQNDDAPLSPQDLRELGRMTVAYVRPAVSEGVPGYAIHGADGAVIGFAPDKTMAIGAILQHGLDVVSLH